MLLIFPGKGLFILVFEKCIPVEMKRKRKIVREEEGEKERHTDREEKKKMISSSI